MTDWFHNDESVNKPVWLSKRALLSAAVFIWIKICWRWKKIVIDLQFKIECFNRTDGCQWLFESKYSQFQCRAIGNGVWCTKYGRDIGFKRHQRIFTKYRKILQIQPIGRGEQTGQKRNAKSMFHRFYRKFKWHWRQNVIDRNMAICLSKKWCQKL